MASGPGTLSNASIDLAGVPSMQNTEASVTLAGVPMLMGAAVVPFSVIVRQAGLPKQPSNPNNWPEQKRPLPLLTLGEPLLSGERLTAIASARAPSQHKPPHAVQGRLQVAEVGQQLWDPGPTGHGVTTVPTPPVGQSRVSPVELVVVQAIPARAAVADARHAP